MSTKGVVESFSEVHKFDESVKPEGGWGWMVVLSAMVICSILDGYTYSTNQFYDEFLLQYKSSESVTSIYSAVMTAVIFFVSPFSSGLIKVYGTGPVSLFGTCLSVLGIILSVYLDQSVYLHIFTIGIIAAAGIGMVFICQVVVVTYWFERKIALATGMAQGGSGFGLAIFSLVINRLISAYGWRGAQLILAGVMSLCFALSAIHSAPTVKIWRSWRDIFCLRTFVAALKETINFSLLWRDYRFTMFALSNCLLSFVYCMPLITVTDRIKKWGIGDASDAARIMFFFGISNGIGRISFGWMATCSPINQVWLYIVSTSLMGLLVALSNLVSSMNLMYGVYFTLGFFYGGNVCLCSIVLIEMLGADMVANAYGIVAALNGATSAAGPPLMNKMAHDVPKDTHADIYSTVMIVSGSIMIFTALLLIPSAIHFKRYNPTKEATVNSTSAQLSLSAGDLLAVKDLSKQQHKSSRANANDGR